MDRRYFLAKLKGADDVSGIILPDIGDHAALVRRAAELLSHLNAAVVAGADVELVPYFPPERQRIRLGPDSPLVEAPKPLTAHREFLTQRASPATATIGPEDGPVP